MKRIVLLFIALLLCSTGWAVNFKQVAYINEGLRSFNGRIKAYDTNHNGRKELLFYVHKLVSLTLYRYGVIYEYSPINQYSILDTINYGIYSSIWDVGDLDNDGKTDLGILLFSDICSVYESQDSISFPENKVWGAGISTSFIQSTYFANLDGDGKKDILTMQGELESLYVYENNGDNQYDLVWTNNVGALGQDLSSFAIGDFDGDSLTDFVTGCSQWKIILWENTGDNQYQVVWTDSITAYGLYDNICIGDINQEGNPEFVIGSHYNSGGNWRAKWSFFKVFGDNQYQCFYEDSLYDNHGLTSYFSASYSGDIDGDGKVEAVLARNNNWQVYKWQNSQVEKIYKAYATDNGRDNTSITVADMNGNGYDEIIESGSISDSTSETKIWEICGEITWDSLTATSKDSCIQVKWSTTRQFANYGFALWRAVGADSNYSIIYETNDTIRLDTLLQAYTYYDSAVTSGTTYYYKVQAKALNDSSLFFGPANVLYTGVSGKPSEPVITYCFKLGQNAPNPFKQLTIINYQLPKTGQVSLKVYNIAGQLVKTLIDGVQGPGAYNIKWNGLDQNNQKVSNGVYFYKLLAGDKQAIRKMVMLR